MNSAWRWPFRWPYQGEMLTLLPEYCPVLVDTVMGDDVLVIMPGGYRFVVSAWSLYRATDIKNPGYSRHRNASRTYVQRCPTTHKPHFCTLSEAERQDWSYAARRRRTLSTV